MNIFIESVVKFLVYTFNNNFIYDSTILEIYFLCVATA